MLLFLCTHKQHPVRRTLSSAVLSANEAICAMQNSPHKLRVHPHFRPEVANNVHIKSISCKNKKSPLNIGRLFARYHLIFGKLQISFTFSQFCLSETHAPATPMPNFAYRLNISVFQPRTLSLYENGTLLKHFLRLYSVDNILHHHAFFVKRFAPQTLPATSYAELFFMRNYFICGTTLFID